MVLQLLPTENHKFNLTLDQPPLHAWKDLDLNTSQTTYPTVYCIPQSSALQNQARSNLCVALLAAIFSP